MIRRVICFSIRRELKFSKSFLAKKGAQNREWILPTREETKPEIRPDLEFDKILLKSQTGMFFEKKIFCLVEKIPSPIFLEQKWARPKKNGVKLGRSYVPSTIL